MKINLNTVQTSSTLSLSKPDNNANSKKNNEAKM